MSWASAFNNPALQPAATRDSGSWCAQACFSLQRGGEGPYTCAGYA